MNLLEILLATLILCLGLLGFAKVEVLALHNSEIAYLQSLASWQLNAMSEHVRACRVALDPATCLAAASKSWETDNKALLPQAKSNIKLVVNDSYSLSIQWQSHVARASVAIIL